MKITKDDFLRNSYVISIDEKRLEKFYQSMDKINFHGIKHLIGRLDSKYPVQNVNETTIGILLYGIRNNLDHITIFEDDAYPVKNFEEEFEKTISSIPDDCYCLALSYSHANSWRNYKNKEKKYDNFQEFKRPLINQKFIHKCWGGTQSYIIFRNDYERCIKFLKQYTSKNHRFDADACLHKENPNFYVKRIPLFVGINDIVENCIHKDEGNKYLKILNNLYHIL